MHRVIFSSVLRMIAHGTIPVTHEEEYPAR